MTAPRVLVLTGPAAAGKNAVASRIAELVPALAVIDIDAVRWMILKPHVAPWSGDEGRRQQELGVRNGCQLAREFVESGFPTVVVDVVTTWTAPVYRDRLGDLGVRIVQLLPLWEVAEARFIERSLTIPSATLDEARLVYDWQLELEDVDDRIDNSALSIDEVAERLAPLLTTHSGRT